MGIDRSKLLNHTLIDTGVLIRWLGVLADSKAASATAFMEAMISAKMEVLVAAPSLTETIRQDSGKIPHLPTINVVNFDVVAARIAGQRFHREILIRYRDDGFRPVDYIKYDAMIVACAVRHRASCIVTLDRGMVALAKGLNPPMPVFSPEYFMDEQMSVF